MKKILISLIIIYFQFIISCYSQHIAMANDKNNFFYKGIDNPVSIAVSGINSDKLIVKLDDKIINGNNGRYVVHPIKNQGSQLHFYVYTIKNRDTVLLGTSSFRVKNIPDPNVYIYGKTGNIYLQKRELFAAHGILAKIEDFEYEIEFIVKSFELKILKNNEYIILKSNSNRFTDEMISIIKETQKDSVITFQNIITSCTDGTVRQLKDNITVTIKE